MNTHAYTRSAVVVWVLCKCAACLKGFGVRARALFVLIPKRKRRVKHLLVVVVLVSLPLSLKAATRRAGGPRGLFLPDVQHCQNAKSSEPPCPKSASENFLFGSALHNGFFHTSPHKHTHTQTHGTSIPQQLRHGAEHNTQFAFTAGADAHNNCQRRLRNYAHTPLFRTVLKMHSKSRGNPFCRILPPQGR